MDCRIMDVRSVLSHQAELGGLSIIEAQKDLLFEFKRVYYIHSVKAGEKRGHHAHKMLKQFLFCPSGSITVGLDDGERKDAVVLDDPAKGLFVGPHVWHDMTWNKDDSVLCVIASDHYAEEDYIRNYNDFLAFIKK